MSQVESAARPIGFAEMAADGTIQLFLRAENGNGVVGHGLVTYPPSHPDYPRLRQLLVGLEVGRRVAVPPWPED